jgi:hypothetical protein
VHGIKREEEEYQYTNKQKRQKESDAYDQKKEQQERELAEKRQSFEKEIAEREQAVKEVEEELKAIETSSRYPSHIQKEITADRSDNRTSGNE